LVRISKRRKMETTSMRIEIDNKHAGIHFELETFLFMPEWLGKFVCKRKDHSWEIWGDVCDRCGQEYSE
jgi:hypothetical protein